MLKAVAFEISRIKVSCHHAGLEAADESDIEMFPLFFFLDVLWSRCALDRH